MRFRGKRETIVLVIAVCVIAVGIYPKNNVTHAIDPFFTLVAYAKGPLAMDYFNLIREQLWRVGIHLDIIQPSVFQWDQSGMHDLEIQAIYNSSIHSPFMREHYSENGTYCLYGYDETLDWVDDLNTGRNAGASGGTQTLALFAGGLEPAVSNKTEFWNGTNWINNQDMNIERRSGGDGNNGTQTSALFATGLDSTGTVATTEEWYGDGKITEVISTS